MHANFSPAMTTITQLLLALFLVGTNTACNNDPEAKTEDQHRWKDSISRIEGSVFYRERIALPGNAELEVQVLDITDPNEPLTLLSSGAVKIQGGPPHDFQIEINLANIDTSKLKDRSYGLRASIHADGKLMFASKGFVDASGGEPKRILVMRVANNENKVINLLEGTHWGLLTLGSDYADLGAGGKQLDIRFMAEDTRAAGFSGCNRFSGRYTREDSSDSQGSLTFGPLAGTRMACPQGRGDIELDYLQALEKVTAYRLLDNTLSLLAGDVIVASFKPL
jgi:putative lipoprotein